MENFEKYQILLDSSQRITKIKYDKILFCNYFRSNSLDADCRVCQYISGISNGKSPISKVINGPTLLSQTSPSVDIGEQATLLVLQRIYQELKVSLKITEQNGLHKVDYLMLL